MSETSLTSNDSDFDSDYRSDGKSESESDFDADVDSDSDRKQHAFKLLVARSKWSSTLGQRADRGEEHGPVEVPAEVRDKLRKIKVNNPGRSAKEFALSLSVNLPRVHCRRSLPMKVPRRVSKYTPHKL